MKSRNKNLNSPDDKITIASFFGMQLKIIKELFCDYKLQTIGIIIMSFLLIGINYIDLKFLEYMTNSVASYVNDDAAYSYQSILFTAAMFLLSLFILQLVSNLNGIVSQKYNSNISAKVDIKLAQKLSSIPYEYYESTPFYEKINLAYQASGQYSNAIWGITQFINIIFLLALYGFMLSKINPLFIVLIFISIFICVIVAVKVTDLQLDYWRKKVSPETRRNNYFKGVFGSRINHNNIQANRSFPFFGNKYEYYNKRERKNYVKLNVFSFYTEISISILFIVVFCITAIFIGQNVAAGYFQIGYFTMIMAMLFNLFSTIKQFSHFMLNQNWYIKVLEAYYKVMNIEENNTINNNYSQNKVFVNNLRYKYPQSEHYALQGISSDFKIGEKIAIIGKNGSGKTTFISIILDLLKNFEGEYDTDNKEIVAILQDFGQYQMTVKENIEIGCGGKELTDEKVIEILKKVELYDFISSKPDGIYTKLGQLEEGVELSKGQWQRIAIGRLLANENALIWILDEPTAYLDPIAEIDVYKFIFNIAKERLVFFISHRLGFAKNADRIILIDEGIIKEEGVHDEMMAKNGLYAEMFTVQKEWYS